MSNQSTSAILTGKKNQLLAMARKWVPQVRGYHEQVFVRGVEVRLFGPGKATSPRVTFFIKSAQALLLAIAVCFSIGASDSGSRVNDLNHRLMCQCGCAQVLGECDHAGCPSRGTELAELTAAIQTGATDDQILSSFAAKYGATVRAAPTTHGFDLVAWVAPFAVFAAALLGTILLVRQWSIGKTQTAALTADPEMDALRAKVRRETGADSDGGF